MGRQAEVTVIIVDKEIPWFNSCVSKFQLYCFSNQECPTESTAVHSLRQSWTVLEALVGPILRELAYTSRSLFLPTLFLSFSSSSNCRSHCGQEDVRLVRYVAAPISMVSTEDDNN